ncbi:MAG: tetratricopeptide repeat protein [Microgenomates group bacterium]
MSKVLNNLIRGIFIAFILLFPSFFSTLFAGTFDLSKIALLVLFVGLLIIFLGIELATQGKLSFKVSSLDLPLLLLVLALIVSAVFKTPNKMEAFLLPGTVTIIISGFLVYFLSKNAFWSQKNQMAQTLLFSAVLVSIFSMFSFLDVFEKIPQLPEFMKDISFSVAGGKLPEVIFLLSVLPLGISLLFAEKDNSKKLLYSVSSVIVLLALIMGISLIIPSKTTAPVLVSFQTSWSVATDSLKSSPIFGVGPGNYLTAFSRFLPISHNSTAIWSIRFSSARSFLFTLITEVGLLGLLSFLLVVGLVVKESFSKLKGLTKNKNILEIGITVSVLILTLSLLFYPANVVLVILFFLLMSLFVEGKEVNLKMPALLSLILFAIAGAYFFFTYKAYSAERQYKKSIDAIVKNDGKGAYDALIKAININPFVDRYHSTYGQVNLALARGLAQKTDLTDQEKNTVAQLIQQAIREGKAVVALNPQRAGSWELLARTYQTIMPFAQGADQFTIDSYTQAVSLDPVNPNLRIGLGGVYYALGKYDDAIKQFELAVVAKPDLANAHYNLSAVYREKKDLDKAISEMKTVLTLVDKDSNDYKVASLELANLEKNKTTGSEGSTGLTPPQKAGEQIISPAIELPSEANPPVSN